MGRSHPITELPFPICKLGFQLRVLTFLCHTESWEKVKEKLPEGGQGSRLGGVCAFLLETSMDLKTRAEGPLDQQINPSLPRAKDHRLPR